MELNVVIFVLLCVGSSRSIFVNPKNTKVKHRGSSSENSRGEARREAEDEAAGTGRPYRAPGDWATPAPDLGIDVGFTPIQTYVSVRRSNTVQHLPRSEAYKESISPDEVLNAHKLKEVVRTKKIQEVYSEEGYEDLGYDHGSHLRVAGYEEDYDKKDKINTEGRKLTRQEDDSDDSESQHSEKIIRKSPKISRKRTETKKVSFSYDRENERKPNTVNRNVGVAKGRKWIAPDPIFSPSKSDFWSSPSQFDDWNTPSNEAEKSPKRKSKRFGKSEIKAKKLTENTLNSLPTFQYIHSLTDAHYGHQSPVPQAQTKSIPSHVIGMTDGITSTSDFSGFESKRMGKRVKRGSEQSLEYERQLTDTLNQHEKYIISASLRNIEFPEIDFPQVTSPPMETKLVPFKIEFDERKYPYYDSHNVGDYSALKYATHPDRFPKKSGFGMEYYESRDRAAPCDEIVLNLENIHNGNSSAPGQKKRIVGLGEKIRCMKIKHFGEDPLDSPFFREDEISQNSTGQKKSDEFPNFKINDSAPDGSHISQQTVHYQVTHPVATAPENKTAGLRVIPVSELEITTPAAIRGMRPPGITHAFMPFSVITIPRIIKPAKQMKKIKYKYNCLQPVSRYTISERSDSDSDDVMIDCQDVTLIQTVRNGNQHFKIIPKKVKRSRFDSAPESKYVRAGEVLESALKRQKRSEDTNARRKSQLFPNRSLLDKMLNRQPLSRRKNSSSTTISPPSEQLSTKPTASSTARPIMTPTVRPRPINRAATSSSTSVPPKTTMAPTSTKKLPKKPTQRLSGLDFLTRYHKSKNSKNGNSPSSQSFFRSTSSSSGASASDLISEGTQNIRNWAGSVEMGSPMVARAAFMRRSDSLERSARRAWDPAADAAAAMVKPPVLLYIVNTETGLGKWISKSSTGSRHFDQLPLTRFY